MGDLNTGPTISIMLFGQAYSKYTTKIQHGHVVALVGMNLLPMKGNQGKDTRISFSVNDIDQMIVVGKALDYAICAGHVMNRNGRGGGVEKKRCTHYVDLRIGKFCKFHVKQQIQTSSKVQSTSSSSSFLSSRNNASSSSQRNSGSKNKLNALQAMKMERAETAFKRQAVQGNRLASTSSSALQSHHMMNNGTNNFLTMTMPQHGGKSLGKTVVTNITSNNINTINTSATASRNTSYSGNNQSSRMMNVPKHMTKGQRITPVAQNNIKGSIRNPYATAPKKVDSSATTLLSRNNQGTNINAVNGDILGSALSSTFKQTITKKNKTNQRNNKGMNSNKSLSDEYQKKRKFVQSYTEGFDGQVSIPKPNKLFSTSKSLSGGMMTSSNQNTTLADMAPITPSPDQKAHMMNKQRMIAEQLRLNKLRSKNHPKGSTKAAATSSSLSSNDKNNFLGFGSTMDDTQRAKLLSTKSKYDMEANAELFAKSRNVLTELEKKEITHDKKKKKAKDATMKDCMITVQWICFTCGKRMTRYKPNVCIRSNHNVRQKRELKQKESIAEKRSGLATKSVSNGGLTVGSGLEWSGWKGH